ncbi:hypothetical protein EDC18_10166 [Natranaerovirga pectinivora]|uniref:Uncharacterized protein n=1 Tax=Natranaerovirga pectinivora TaxID=682400 RepID=A0A4R3MNH8_9FIRM|nr:hypothetical protein [Natranaerovirga pectinivora]TCT16771.1 hypothetical protein EDC18_10166 [Natranaerovirga pectinivora]
MMPANLYISSFKWTIKLILFVIGICFIVYLVGEYFESIALKNKTMSYTIARFQEFYELEENTLDMVFIGSSHSYCSFDPEIFDEALEINSFQLGTPLQHPDTSYFVLREVLNYQKPSIVVFEIYWDMLDEPFNLRQVDMFFEALDNDALKEAYIHEVFPLNEKVKYYIKAIRYQGDFFAYYNQRISEWLNRNEIIEDIDLIKEQIGTEFYRSKGYVVADYVITRAKMEEENQFNGFDGRQWMPHPNQLEYIDKFIQLSIENDIEVILVTAPVANISMERIENYDYIHKKISRLTEGYELPYIDYNIVNVDEGIFVNEHFRDDAHLNHQGAEVLNDHFIRWGVENELFDRVLN